MPAMELLSTLIGFMNHMLTKEEILFLEAGLFSSICTELKEFFRHKQKDYFRLMKFNYEMENAMLDENLLRLIMNDIIASEEYTLEGIARYTDTHEDIVRDVISGKNNSPSAILLRRTIELHRSIRRDLYHEIMKKAAMLYLTAA